MKFWLNMTGRVVRNDISVTDSCLCCSLKSRALIFFILLLGFVSSILGFPRAQKDTILDEQADCWKVSVLSAHWQHLCCCYICQDPNKFKEANDIWRCFSLMKNTLHCQLLFIHFCGTVHFSINRPASEFSHSFFCTLPLILSTSLVFPLTCDTIQSHMYKHHSDTNWHWHST